MFNINSTNQQKSTQQAYKIGNIPASSSISMLLKSKSCVDKLSYRINEVGRNINNNGSTFKCIEQTAKDIKFNIESKIQHNFNTALNDQTRVNLNQHTGLIGKEKQEATKKLMQDYWNKRQENQSEARRKTMIVCKQNIFPKIKNNDSNEERSLREIKPTKKAIISSLNVKNYEKQQQKQTIKRTKQEKILAYLYSYMVNIIDYKVQNNTPQFLLFQKFNYTKWDDIQHVIKSVQSFCQKYQLKYCTLDLQKVMQLIQSKCKTQKQIKSSSNCSSKNITFTNMPNSENTPQLWTKKYTPHQLLGLLENSEQISARNQKKAGIRFYGNKGKIRAIIKIQASIRGKIVYNKIKKVRQMIKKLVKIQRAYRIYKKYCKTKEIISQKCVQKYKWYVEKQKQFKNNYRINEMCKKIKYEIHICSDSQSEWQRLSTQKFLQKQNGYLTRIFKAFNQNVTYQTRIIYISASPIPTQIMNYYSKLLELGGASQFRNKITFMSPQNCEKFLDKYPLTRVIYYCSSMLKKLKSIIGGEYAYIVPSTPSIDFVSVCHFLNIPIYSSHPQALLSLQTNSGCKALIQEVYKKNEYPYLPYCKNIYSLRQLVSELAQLIQQNPFVWRWIFKIDNQSNSRGLAYLDVHRILPKKMLRFIRKVHSQYKPSNKQQTIAPQIRNLSEEIINFVHQSLIEGQKLILANKSAYRYQNQFLNFFFSNGGILQAQINNFDTQVENLCFCIEIQPDNQWRFICNFRKVTIKKRAPCCYFDSLLIQPPIQIQLIVKQLLKRQCFGYFVLDFIKQSAKQDDQEKKIYFNGIKCYLDSFSSASFMREFISKESNALYIPYISHDNIKKITMSTFFHLCRLQNISFDIERKIGNIFMFLDGLQSGCIGMMTFNDSSKIQTFIHAAEVLDFFTSKMDQSGSTNSNQQFLLIRNSINGYLNFLRKKQFALKSNAQNQKVTKKTKKRNESYKDRQFL